MVVGHPCSLRRGIALQPDIPVAPIAPPGIPTRQHHLAERLLPVREASPAGNRAEPRGPPNADNDCSSSRLGIESRVATLSAAGIVALQQRVVGNQSRVKIPPGVISAHVRGPLTELELWTDWREQLSDAGHEADDYDAAFDAFMTSASTFGELDWRSALGEREHARARAVPAMEEELARQLGGG